MLRRFAPWLILFGLVACSGLPHRRPPADALDDPALTTALQELLCQVGADCSDIHLQLRASRNEQAEMFPDGRLQLNLGLLLATRNTAEAAFVLAHESAHRARGHRLTRSPERRTRLELQADADAALALRDAGMPPEAGLQLLQRLLLQAEAAEPPASAEGLAQIRARIAAMLATAQPGPAADAIADDRLQRLLAPYRKAPPAEASR